MNTATDRRGRMIMTDDDLKRLEALACFVEQSGNKPWLAEVAAVLRSHASLRSDLEAARAEVEKLREALLADVGKPDDGGVFRNPAGLWAVKGPEWCDFCGGWCDSANLYEQTTGLRVDEEKKP